MRGVRLQLYFSKDGRFFSLEPRLSKARLIYQVALSIYGTIKFAIIRFPPNLNEKFVFQSVSINFEPCFLKNCLHFFLDPRLPCAITPLKLSGGIINSYFNKNVPSSRLFCFIKLIWCSIHQNSYRLNPHLSWNPLTNF